MGGVAEDTAMVVVVSTDGYVYVAGDGYSTSIVGTNSEDVYLLRYSYDGTTLGYFTHFGGTQPDSVTDM
jgi:hypothetical protein